MKKIRSKKAIGEKLFHSTLTIEKIDLIKKCILENEMTMPEIAKIFGTHRGMVFKIKAELKYSKNKKDEQ